MEEATWLWLIMVVPKKNGKLQICMDFRKLNVATKKDPYPLPFTKKVLDMVANMKFILSWIFQLPSNPHCSPGSVQDYIHYGMRSFCVGCDAFWFEEHTTYLAIGGYSFLRLPWHFYETLFGWFQYIEWYDMNIHLAKFCLCFNKCRTFGINLNPKNACLWFFWNYS